MLRDKGEDYLRDPLGGASQVKSLATAFSGCRVSLFSSLACASTARFENKKPRCIRTEAFDL